MRTVIAVIFILGVSASVSCEEPGVHNIRCEFGQQGYCWCMYRALGGSGEVLGITLAPNKVCEAKQ